MIGAGQLKHRVEIEQPIIVQNETGEEVPDWNRSEPIWAKHRTLERARGHAGQCQYFGDGYAYPRALVRRCLQP